jgi:hypothetical protein
MPVDRTESRFADERLPDDRPAAWVCANDACGFEQAGPLEQGCVKCGAGAPGAKASKPQPTLEELEGGLPMDPNTNDALMREVRARPTPSPGMLHTPQSTLLSRMRHSASAEEIRQVVREELQAIVPQLGGLKTLPVFTPRERYALFEGLQIVHQMLQDATDLPPEERAKFPDETQLAELAARLQEQD